MKRLRLITIKYSHFNNSDNWFQYLNLQINQQQLQICLLRVKIKNRLERSHKIVTRSYNEYFHTSVGRF